MAYKKLDSKFNGVILDSVKVKIKDYFKLITIYQFKLDKKHNYGLIAKTHSLAWKIDF